MKYLIVFAFCVFTFLFIMPFILSWYDRKNGTHYSCDKFGWHDGRNPRDDGEIFDGCSRLAKCSKCGKDVMQDSQGNWF